MLLAREGLRFNHKKLYREERLAVRDCDGRKRALGTRRPMKVQQAVNRRRSLDFASDAFGDGRHFRVLCVLGDFSRWCLALVVDALSRFSPVVDPRFSYQAEDVVATQEQACSLVGYPKTIRVDQGSKFVSRDLDYSAPIAATPEFRPLTPRLHPAGGRTLQDCRRRV
jgi:Integrase core domain.